MYKQAAPPCNRESPWRGQALGCNPELVWPCRAGQALRLPPQVRTRLPSQGGWMSLTRLLPSRVILLRPVNTHEAPGHPPSCWGHRDRLGFQTASPGNPLGLWRGWNPRPQQCQEPRTQHLLSGADGIPGRRATATWPGLGRDPSPPQTPRLCRLVLLSPEAPAACTGPELPSSEMGHSLPRWC